MTSVPLSVRLRTLPALTGDLPEVAPYALPADPAEAFVAWLDAAIEVGAAEPHAMTVSTTGPDGSPSARVVLLTDVQDGAWRFATDVRSVKARNLAADPRCSLTFYWQPLGRQVRVEGRACLMSQEERTADFLARPPSARAALVGADPGRVLGSWDEVAQQVRRARQRVQREPGLVPDTWQVWSVEPEMVEFWQGVSDRAHMRLVYRRDQDHWDRRLVAP